MNLGAGQPAIPPEEFFLAMNCAVKDAFASLQSELQNVIHDAFEQLRLTTPTLATSHRRLEHSSTPISDPEIEIVHSHLWKARCKQVALKSTAVTGGVQKRHRSRPGNIGSLATCKHLKRKVSFQRLVAEIAQDVKADWRFQTSVVPSLLGSTVSVQLNLASNCPVSGTGTSIHNLSFLNESCDSVFVAKLGRIDAKNEEGEYYDKKVKVNCGDVKELGELEGVNVKRNVRVPNLGEKGSERHALQLLDEMPQSKGLCIVGRTVAALTSIRDKGGGLAYFQPLEDVIRVNYAEENEGNDKYVGKADQLEDGNAILKMEISTELIKRENMLKGAPKKKDLADEIVLASHNHVNESIIKYMESWDRNTLEKIDDACLKQEEGNALLCLYPRCGKAELEDEVHWMYRYADSVSLLEHDIKPGPLYQSGLNFGSGNTCESEALRVKKMMFQVTNRKMLFNQAPDDKDGYDIHDDDHKCHLHSIFMEPLLAFYLRYIHRHPILGRYEFLARVSYTGLNVEKYIFGTIVNIRTALVIEYGPSGIVEVSEKWSLDAMNMKMEAIIKIIGCTVELELLVNFTVELELLVNFLGKHMQLGEKCGSFHHDQGLISSCMQFNNFLVNGKVECIFFCCCTLLQWIKLQLYVEVVQNGINHMMHTSLLFQAVVDLYVCPIIEFGIVATLNVWLHGILLCLLLNIKLEKMSLPSVAKREEMKENARILFDDIRGGCITANELVFKFEYHNPDQLLSSLSTLDGDLEDKDMYIDWEFTMKSSAPVLKGNKVISRSDLIFQLLKGTRKEIATWLNAFAIQSFSYEGDQRQMYGYSNVSGINLCMGENYCTSGFSNFDDSFVGEVVAFKTLSLVGAVKFHRIGDARVIFYDIWGRWKSIIIAANDYCTEELHEIFSGNHMKLDSKEAIDSFERLHGKCLGNVFLAVMTQCSINPIVFVDNVLLGDIDERVNLHFASEVETKANIVGKMFDKIWMWKCQTTSGTSAGVICAQEFNVDFFGCFVVLDVKCSRDAISGVHFRMSSVGINLLLVPVHWKTRGCTFDWHLEDIIESITRTMQKLFGEVGETFILKFSVSSLYLRQPWCRFELVASGGVGCYHGNYEHKRLIWGNNMKVSLLPGFSGSHDTQETFEKIFSSTLWFSTYIDTDPREFHIGTTPKVVKVMGLKGALCLARVTVGILVELSSWISTSVAPRHPDCIKDIIIDRQACEHTLFASTLGDKQRICCCNKASWDVILSCRLLFEPQLSSRVLICGSDYFQIMEPLLQHSSVLPCSLEVHYLKIYHFWSLLFGLVTLVSFL